MTLSAKAPNPEGAYRFLSFILDADAGAQLSNCVACAAPNEASLSKIDDAVRKDPRVYPPEAHLARMVMLEDVGDATTLYDQIWTRPKAGQYAGQ